jgi:acetylornithine deacetylase/succinyl-diaminopimelate desuccinylase-like protein
VARRPIINLGVKGMLYVELVSYGPSMPLHSGLAVLVRNPAWNLVKALNTMWDEKRSLIPIKEWSKEVTGFTKEELVFISSQPMFDEIEFKKRYKINRLLSDIKGTSRNAYLQQGGLHAGNGPKEIKTIIPSVARAKIDFRLVPKMEPKKQFERLKNHLRQYGLGDIYVRFVHGVAASRTSYTDEQKL